MLAYFNIISIALLLLFMIITWLGSRYLGRVGMVLAHLIVLVGYFAWVGLAIDAGNYKYDGMISVLGLFIQAFLLNCLLLPVAIFALRRRRRSAGASEF
jgi:hypothetical protein